MPQGRFNRTRIRGMTNMPAARSGTVNMPIQIPLQGFMTQNSFCQRTAANIAKANHQNTHRSMITDKMKNAAGPKSGRQRDKDRKKNYLRKFCCI